MGRLEDAKCDISKARTMDDIAGCVYSALDNDSIDVYRLDGVSEKVSLRLVSVVEVKAEREGRIVPFHYRSSKDGSDFFSYSEIVNS